MKVLITGGAGFIGSHLCDKLISLGNQVTALDNLSTGKEENLSHVRKNRNFNLIVGSVLEEKTVDKLCRNADLIFHLAAAVGVELIVKKPLESLTTNIKGSEIVLGAAQRFHKKVLITSTSEIYGKNAGGPLKEDDDRVLGSPLKSRWGYSTAKAVDEMLAYVYWKEKGLPTVIVRLFNTVGPRQTGAYGMVIPRFVNQALKGQPLTVYGDGSQSRCFLHVQDAVFALVKLIEHPHAHGEVFNLGSQEEVTIKQLAEKVIELTQSNSRITYVPYEKAYEEGFEDMQRRVPDTTKLQKLIGYKPATSLKQILNSVIAYFKEAN